MVLWNVRSKRSLAGISEPGGRTLEEEKKEKEAGGGSWTKTRRRPAVPTLRRWSRLGAITAHSCDSKPAGWLLPVFGISPPNNPSLGQLLEGQLAKQELLC